MEPMLEPAEARTFLSVPVTIAPLARRRRCRRRRQGWPGAASMPTRPAWQALGRYRRR
jgi:hypothetical protein